MTKTAALNRPYLHNEKAAYAFVESQLWADGRPCPHCGVLDESTALKGASMNVRQSVFRGSEELVRAEVLRVRQIVELSGGTPPLLFLLDELFAGPLVCCRQLG